LKESELIVGHRKTWMKANPRDFYYKIPDTLGLGGQKPFDAFAWGHRRSALGGPERRVFAWEFKIHKSHNAFPLSKIQPHQIMGLTMAEQGGAISTVFIGVRFTMDVDTQKRLGLRLRRISIDIEIPIQEIVSMIKGGQKSIPILPYLLKEINGE